MTAQEQTVRMCVSCRQRLPSKVLVRLSLDSQGQVTVQPRRPHGRGAYLCPTERCLTRAVKKGGLRRGLRTRAVLPSPKSIALAAASVVGSRLSRIALCRDTQAEQEQLTALLSRLNAALPRLPDTSDDRTTVFAAMGGSCGAEAARQSGRRPKGGPANFHGQS